MSRQLTHSEHKSTEKSFSIIVAGDHLSSPANIGALFRLCDAFGVQEILFIGNEPDISSNRLKRTARNTQNTLPYKNNIDTSYLLNLKNNEGYTIIGIEITDTSKPITDFKIISSKKVIVIIGNEKYGISEDLLAICEESYHINMRGINSSMNVSHAAAIALHEISAKINQHNN